MFYNTHDIIMCAQHTPQELSQTLTTSKETQKFHIFASKQTSSLHPSAALGYRANPSVLAVFLLKLHTNIAVLHHSIVL